MYEKLQGHRQLSQVNINIVILLFPYQLFT